MSDMSRGAFLRRAGVVGAAVPLAGMILEGPALGATRRHSGSRAIPKNQATGQSVLVSPPVANNVYWDGWTGGATAACDALGMKAKVENFSGDTNRQLGSFQNIQTLGLKGVMTMANVAAASPKLFGTAQRQKVYAVNSHSNQPWSTPLDIGDYFVEYLEPNSPAAFEAISTFVFKKMGGKGNVLHISGLQGTSASEYRDIGFNTAVKKFPGIKVVGVEYGGFSRVGTVPVVENLLTAHPDVQAIICQNDDSALGAISVLKKKGIKAYVTGFDAVPEALDAIASGDMVATVANSGPWLGRAMIVRIFDAMNGVKLPTVERMMQFEAFVVNTPAAAKLYKKQTYGSGSLYDVPRMSRFLNPNDWDMQIGMNTVNPAELWAPYVSAKPKGYQLPAAYRAATKADYAKADAMYKAHLKRDGFAAVKKLTTSF